MSDSKQKGKKKGKKAKAPVVIPVDKTAKGSKKDLSSQPIPDAYYPSYVESAWYEWWEKEGLFRPELSSQASPSQESKDQERAHKDKFVMMIPPPNVTGTLHLGHTLMCAIEDTITRWNRMCGRETLWLPGTDHAGIATQSVVERKLMRERKVRRQDLGREKFLQEVWKWKEQSGSHICRQLRRLGSSCDWTREAFTMDERLSRAVKEAFVRMYDKGLIYRQARMVNWSCALQTAISEIEVDKIDIDKPTYFSVPGHKDKVEFGIIHKFKYPIKGTKECLIVATTRIETMLGDVAVAVHPDDTRYQALIGREIEHPFIPERKMRVIADPVLVDMAFGTGAVKITPAHDNNDFECGLRHKLPFINILDDRGCINDKGGQYAGMKRFEARARIIKDLDEKGLYVGKESNKMVLGFCSRSKDVIEPVIRPQWWVDTKDMARRSVEAVETGKLQIKPEHHKKTWYKFLRESRPWCISRQLWWGHRIPAYFIRIDKFKPTADDRAKAEKEGYQVGSDSDANFWVAARSKDEALTKARERFRARGVEPDAISVEQDEDVLDTWFSSGLFPFSTLGWPEQTPDLAKFFPGHLLETGHDILFFWVARMVMMSLELTDKLPFDTVFLHAMVRDKLGRKMSKSLGNVVDPISVMEGVTLEQLLDKIRNGNLAPAEHKRAMAAQRKDFPKGIEACGADALRYGLLTYLKQGRSINLDINVVISCKHFCNKLWQASKFALTMFDKGFVAPATEAPRVEAASAVDRWALSRLYRTVVKAQAAFQAYEFADAAIALRSFWMDEFCANYLEMVKVVRYDDDAPQAAKAAAQQTLFICIETTLRLLHPIIPFVTEELWQRLPARASPLPNVGKAKCKSIMVAPYPRPEDYKAYAASGVEAAMEQSIALIGAVRSLRAKLGLTKQKTPIYIVTKDDAPAMDTPMSDFAKQIAFLASGSEIIFSTPGDPATKQPPPEAVSELASPGRTVYVPVKGFVDLGKMVLGYEKKADNVQGRIDALEATRAKPRYANTPESIQKEHKQKLETMKAEAKEHMDAMTKFLDIMSPQERKDLREKKVATLTAAADKYAKDLEKVKAKLPDPKDAKKYKKMLGKFGTKIKKFTALIEKTQKKLKQIQAQAQP